MAIDHGKPPIRLLDLNESTTNQIQIAGFNLLYIESVHMAVLSIVYIHTPSIIDVWGYDKYGSIW